MAYTNPSVGIYQNMQRMRAMEKAKAKPVFVEPTLPDMTELEGKTVKMEYFDAETNSNQTGEYTLLELYEDIQSRIEILQGTEKRESLIDCVG